MWPRRRKLIVAAVLGVLVLLIGGRMAADWTVQLLWYRSVGYARVFWTIWGLGLALRAVAGLVVGLFLLANLWLVARSLGTIRVRRRFGNIEIAERLPQSYTTGVILLVSFLSAWWLSGAIADPVDAWAAVRMLPWGVEDPIFHRDVAFFVFRLPVLDGVQTLAGVLIVWTVLLSAAAYLATGAIRVAENRVTATPLARRHLGLLGAAFLLVVAWDLWLDRFALLWEAHGFGGGFGYTDLHARLPGLALDTAVALLAAAAVGYGAWSGRFRWPLAGVGALTLALVGTQGVYPALVQKLNVEPNEFAREERFIAAHIDFTRRAYGLQEVRRVDQPYQSAVGLPRDSLVQRLAGAPLWDPRPLLTAYNQKESLFRYYQFNAVEADRYAVGDSLVPVAVAAREIDPRQLPRAAQTWQNLHLNYVKGQGVVVSPTAAMSDDGEPVYFVRDLDPPRVSADAPPTLDLTEPSLYFARATSGYVVVDSAAAPQGVALDRLWKKLALAWAFQSKNLLLSGRVSSRSRVVFQRGVLERVNAVAPFLLLSGTSGAHPVVYRNHVVWLVDGYTASSLFPLASLDTLGTRPVRYVRNSVKATVDALTGEVRLYAVDDGDPMLRTYARLFPGLLRPLTEMPPQLRAHLRFPPELLALQARVLTLFHLTDPAAFYAKQDVWAVATEKYRDAAEAMRPSFAVLRLPGDDRREFVLTLPLSAQGRPNLAGLLVARNDPPHYGERLLFNVPRDKLVPGPEQIESLIDQDPEISQQLSLWKEGGSDVIRGHLVTVPLDSTLVYLEPLYLEAQNTAIPQLERVILVSGQSVVMRRTLGEAVAALLGGEEAVAGPAPAPGAPGAPGGPSLRERARALLQQADAELRAGDWSGFGRSWSALRALLAQPDSGAPRP